MSVDEIVWGRLSASRARKNQGGVHAVPTMAEPRIPADPRVERSSYDRFPVRLWGDEQVLTLEEAEALYQGLADELARTCELCGGRGRIHGGMDDCFACYGEGWS